MAIRKVYAPYSTTGEQVGQTPVEGYVDVKQEITPIILTGELGKDGEWSGVTVSDKSFNIDAEHLAIPNGAAVLSPQAEPQYIDMTGFNDLFIAFNVSNGGNFKLEAVMGPDTYPFANLSPINAAASLKGNATNESAGDNFYVLFDDGSEALTADVWNIFNIQSRLSGQKLLQFKITNSSGGESSIQFAALRVV